MTRMIVCPEGQQTLLPTVTVAVVFALLALAEPLRAQNENLRTDQEHEAWVIKSPAEMQTIKAGMTRPDLYKVFTIQGGSRTRTSETDVYCHCGEFQVKVQYMAVGKDLEAPGNPADRIVSISPPFVAGETPFAGDAMPCPNKPMPPTRHGVVISAAQAEAKPALKHKYPAGAQAKRHSVIDYFNLLIHPDSSPAEQLAVFRTHSEADLLAVSMPDFQSDYNFFALYRLQNDKLRDVTRQMLPVPARPARFLYKLPRVGTAIRVFRFDLNTQSPRHAFDLQWHKGHFIKAQ